MLIPHKGHTDTIQVYSVTVMTHVKALQAGHSSQGTSEPITPGWKAEKTPGGYMMISPRAATDPEGGGGFATRISSTVRPQDPGGGGGCNTDHRSPGWCLHGVWWCWLRRPGFGVLDD